jgi:hypothetical protein
METWLRKHFHHPYPSKVRDPPPHPLSFLGLFGLLYCSVLRISREMPELTLSFTVSEEAMFRNAPINNPLLK